MKEQGLYNPLFEHENCGAGFICSLEGKKTNDIISKALNILTCLEHRGAVSSDGRTGDGAGILIEIPDIFFKKECKFNLPEFKEYAVGMVFLPPKKNQLNYCVDIFEEEIKRQGLNIFGWRDVPVNSKVVGAIASQSQPNIKQVFVGKNDPNQTEKDFLLKLYISRKISENRIYQSKLSQRSFFYFSSLHNKTIIYKGLLIPEDIERFYTDLTDKRVVTRLALVHQRFSTNTFPTWDLAQPFRYMCHNGEINTYRGNLNRMKAREELLKSDFFGDDIQSILPIVLNGKSDSASMDMVVELLLHTGRSLPEVMMMMVPEAWEKHKSMDPAKKAFYSFNSCIMEPWDGPAGIVLTDGRYACCLLDRNGLRPARWVTTDDGFITLASEIGTHGYQPNQVIAKGRVGPGQILVVDTQEGKVLHTRDIDELLKARQPYKQWLRQNARLIEGSFTGEAVAAIAGTELDVYQKMFQVSFEERDQVLRPLAESGNEAVGSMGDDTPMAVLSRQERSLYDFFRQKFAQVTNPPIDPLRESIVMSFEVDLGPERNIFEENAEHARRISLTSPVLSQSKFRTIKGLEEDNFRSIVIDATYDSSEASLRQALEAVCSSAEGAVREGYNILVLSDRNLGESRVPLHSLLVTGTLHHYLIRTGVRAECNLVVESGSARDSHHVACLLGFGATAVYPYLAYSVIEDLLARGELLGDPQVCQKNFRKGINKGLLKIMSKMGISAVNSYRGAQLFEAVGLDAELVDIAFTGVTSRIGGVTLDQLEKDQWQVASRARSRRKTLDQGGLLKYVHGGEYHAYNPDVVMSLQSAVVSGDYGDYQRYASHCNERPVAALRDLLRLKLAESPLVLDEVEPIDNILRRFDSAGMSLGALSPEAHEALAMGMNQIGARSNSGEGGEDPDRYGTNRVSKIKQIASGRFGVTPHYLVNAEVLQIKVAQGAKPGEGGQLPGGKVNDLIARLRYSVPGVTLISPPPHHDIYSIEDLAQLIFDLKQVNPDALVSVKLVSEPGVGTIAAGVTKAYADLITISGYDGGTAASPLTSIRYAGSPWELGIAEVHQTLRGNRLRGKVRLQADGGMKTGLDVVKAAILGAESFGFGTAPMVAMGCKYLRICHLNNCATGVATQNAQLRQTHFVGDVERVVNFLTFVATETREWLAKLGVRTLKELIGRVDLLECLPGDTAKQQSLDLAPILWVDEQATDQPQFCQVESNDPFDTAEKASQMIADMLPAIEAASGGSFSYTVTNCDRSIGARLSGEIAKRHGNTGMETNPVTVRLTGTAGQSFGVWNAGGLHMYLEGDCNDYVGKGMAGGKLVIAPPEGSRFESRETSIIGNTCLYGATGGRLFAAGVAGERFAVRNSGAHAVIEGAGDHCCEYMTGGLVTVLGSTGVNFGAGMTGGLAFVLDEDRAFIDRYNSELVEIHRVAAESMEAHRHFLRDNIREFVAETGSAWGTHLLDNFEDYVGKFWLVKPKAADINQLLSRLRDTD